jgi:hypothetical protein
MRKDGDGCWKCWRSKFDPRDCTYEEVDGCVDGDVIANKFDKFIVLIMFISTITPVALMLFIPNTLTHANDVTDFP